MVDRNERHPVYLFFQFRYGWQCQFLEPDLKTSLPRKPVLDDSEKLIGLVERGGGLPDLTSRQALDQAIAKGRRDVSQSHAGPVRAAAEPAIDLWNQNEPRISVSLLLRNLENSLYLSPL